MAGIPFPWNFPSKPTVLIIFLTLTSALTQFISDNNNKNYTNVAVIEL